MDARARKRSAIGLEPDRETAPDTFLRPPDESSRGAQWLLVLCMLLLGLAVLMLLLSRTLTPDTTLGSLLGRPESAAIPETVADAGQLAGDVAAGIAANLPDGSTWPAWLAQLPGYEVWLTDDFVAPSRIAPQQSLPGRLDAAVVADIGVYRMQVSPNQMGWTLFDLEGTGAYHLETSATVSADTPGGSAGVIARFGGAGNFYLLTVDGDGAARVQLWRNGEAFDMQMRTVITNNAGQANRLAVEDDGQRIRFYINQILASEIVEPQLPPGRPGIAALAEGDQGATVDFDWIALYRPQS
jgi:hypothetical protein